MHIRTHRILLAALVLAGSSFALTASAQINPEEGGVWVPPPDDTEQPPPHQQQQQQPWYGQQQQQQQQPPPQQQQQVTAQSTSAQQQPVDGRSDHSRMVGHLAVGWMGVTSVPIGSQTGGFAIDSVTTPAIGIRYWLGDLAGLDIGLGLGFTGGNIESGTNSVPVDNAFAMLIHGGVPLAIFHAQHYTFLIVPEINLGFSTGTAYGFDPDNDRSRSGFLFSVGGRLGGEIHFGFMNIPNLSLQASVGLYFEYSSAGLSADRTGNGRAGATGYALGTTVMGEPWDIFLGSLQALYYF